MSLSYSKILDFKDCRIVLLFVILIMLKNLVGKFCGALTIFSRFLVSNFWLLFYCL
uniref:Uncharacterized protein n=1 Tax=Rhizophora mucronata TaxID=61149 RepID=A0A2P2N0C6_RHIMU